MFITSNFPFSRTNYIVVQNCMLEAMCLHVTWQILGVVPKFPVASDCDINRTRPMSCDLWPNIENNVFIEKCTFGLKYVCGLQAK